MAQALKQREDSGRLEFVRGEGNGSDFAEQPNPILPNVRGLCTRREQVSQGRDDALELFCAPYHRGREARAPSGGPGNVGRWSWRGTRILPPFQTTGRSCGGVQIHADRKLRAGPAVSGRRRFDLPDHFAGRTPLRYVHDKNPFDVIAGTDKLRKAFERGASLDSIKASWAEGLRAFGEIRARYLLY